MNWFYSEGDQQRGPVSDSQLDELLRSGKISPATLIWREGMTGWQPLNVAQPMVPPTLSGASTVCVECGRTFPPDELIQLNNSPVCAQCKPVFLQRLKEGAALPAASNLWQLGKKLIARSETIFPDRCVKCNAPANGYRLKRQLFWMHPAYYLFIFCNLLILLIVYMIVRKKAVVHIGLCEAHRAKRKNGLVIGWSSLGLAVVLFILAGVVGSGWFVLAGFLALLIGGITGAVMARTVTPAKIDKEYVWLTGVHKDFLTELPEWRGL